MSPRILVLRGPGTNCDAETVHALRELGAEPELVHVRRLVRTRALEVFEGLVIPGGFSYGDRIRSGAVLARMLSHALGRELQRFVDEGKPVLGICNGFQVLVETGVLPFGQVGEPALALMKNASARFEARWVHLLRCSDSELLGELPEVSEMPVANAEGRVVLPPGRAQEVLDELLQNSQVALRYCTPSGEPAEGRYPANPSGSFWDIAGLTTPNGRVLGMMPHPERAFSAYLHPCWTSGRGTEHGRVLLQGFVRCAGRA